MGISGKQLSFEDAFHEATKSVLETGGKIHFNLDGFDVSKAFGNRGKGLYDDGVGYTDWEFGQILDNAKLRKNTIFYDKSGKVEIDNLINEVQN